jgi:streptomycin 6-kinase
VKWQIPSRLRANCRKTSDRLAWLDRLPNTLEHFERRWSLTFLSPFDEGSCAWVAPVIRADGTGAVLKIGMPHFEGAHELQGLRFWDGDPTVRVLEADEDSGAMLLEQCEPGTALRSEAENEQDLVIAQLLHRLWRSPPAHHPFRPLSALTRYWSDETLAGMDRWPDKALVREGLRLLAELPRTAPMQVVLATDLHAGNVRRARREPWLVIDPKPFVGEPAVDVTQHLFNRPATLCARPDEAIHRMADLLAVDDERIRLWTFARAAAEPRDDWTNSDLIAIARALSP